MYLSILFDSQYYHIKEYICSSIVFLNKQLIKMKMDQSI